MRILVSLTINGKWTYTPRVVSGVIRFQSLLPHPLYLHRMKMKSLAVAGLISLSASFVANAASSMYHGTFVVTSNSEVNSSQIAIGDVLYYQFEVNLAAIDVDGSVNYAQFPNAITSFTFGKVGGTGTWDPGDAGMWTISSSAYSDNGELRFLVDGSGFPAVEHYASNEDDPFGESGGYATTISLNPSFNVTRNDTGAGQTFEQSMGELQPTWANYYFWMGPAEIGTEHQSFAAGASPYAVPEASSSLLAIGSIVLTLMRRKRK